MNDWNKRSHRPSPGPVDLWATISLSSLLQSRMDGWCYSCGRITAWSTTARGWQCDARHALPPWKQPETVPVPPRGWRETRLGRAIAAEEWLEQAEGGD